MNDPLRDLLQKAVGDHVKSRPSDKSQPGDKSRIVSPDDERGTPYKGDFPNPLDGKVPGCF
jgi:hypothetical protein